MACFTTFVDGIAYLGRVTFWLISKYAYRGNVTVDGLSGVDLSDVRPRNDELKSALLYTSLRDAVLRLYGRFV